MGENSGQRLKRRRKAGWARAREPGSGGSKGAELLCAQHSVERVGCATPRDAQPVGRASRRAPRNSARLAQKRTPRAKTCFTSDCWLLSSPAGTEHAASPRKTERHTERVVSRGRNVDVHTHKPAASPPLCPRVAPGKEISTHSAPTGAFFPAQFLSSQSPLFRRSNVHACSGVYYAPTTLFRA